MSKSSLIIGSAIGLVMAAGTIGAQADPNFYMGLGGTYANYDEDINIGGAKDNFNDGVGGISAFIGGESVLPNSRGVSIGGELAFDWHDSLEDDPFGFVSKIDLWSINLTSKLFVPVDRKGVFRVNLQGGLSVVNIDTSIQGGGSVDDTETYGVAGTGFDVRVAPGFRIGVDYRYTFVEDADFHVTGLRGLYYF